MDLTELLERTLPALGYELVDVELSPKDAGSACSSTSREA